MEFINEQAQRHPSVAAEYLELGRLCDQKLWHQLTVKLDQLLRNNAHFQGPVALELYDGFISTFETKINQARFANLISFVGKNLADNNAALELFNRILSKTKLDNEAKICIEMEIALVKLRAGDVADAKAKLEEYKPVVTTLQSSESLVFSKFYQAQTEYKKVVGPAHEYYSSALMFLAYTHIDDLTAMEKYTLAQDMSLAAITGEKIYNFGEILATPILNHLENTPSSWLKVIVESLNRGDMQMFHQTLQQHSQQLNNTPVLVANKDFIIEKAILLTIVNLVFQRPSHDRIIRFSEIADKCAIPVEKVEWMLMRAMSLELIKGKIDDVDSTVNVSWVQPRVLDKSQLSSVRDQLATWSERVKTTLVSVEDQTVELFA